MTVDELLKVLRDLPPHAQVRMSTEDGEYPLVMVVDEADESGVEEVWLWSYDVSRD